MKQKVKLKDIASYSKGSQINGTELIENGEFDYLNGGINPSGKWNEANCNADTIAISEGGNSCGYVNYMRKPFWCGAHCYYLYDTVANTKYLYYALKSQQERIMKLRSGACMPNIKKSDLGNFEFIFDDDDKQQKNTTDILNKIERVIELRQKEIFYLDELVKARFVEMFGDPISNPMKWETKKLEEYIIFLTSGSRGWAKYFTEKENELFITIKNVKNNKISMNDIQYVEAPKNKEAERTKVKSGDLLISITADLGRTGVVDEEIADRGAYINQHLSLVRLDKNCINPMFVSYYLETEGGKIQFESKNQAGVKAGLNFEAIKSLNIIVPPIELQNKYLSFVQQVDKSKSAIKKSLEETQILFDSLMQKYFG